MPHAIIHRVTNRRDRVAEADRRARRQLQAVLDDIHEGRLAAGARQSDVARLVGISRARIGAIERGRGADIGLIRLSRMAATVGLDLSIRTFPGEEVLRDAGQVALLNALRHRCRPDLRWRLEVGVAPGDPRAFDALIGSAPRVAAVEAITRFRDEQAQVRRAQGKLEAAGLSTLILVLADTHANRRALRDAGSQLRDAFPLGSRAILAMLERGEVPTQNGILVLRSSPHEHKSE